MPYTQNDYTPLENLVRQYQRNGTFSNRCWQQKAKVSVVVTVYNQEEQLRKQLLALSQQTYDPNSIEVIIADDGSRRGTGSCMDLVAKMSLPFDVKYVWQPHTTFRAAKIRNEAMKRASHETVICIDTDMVVSHDYVEKVMQWHYAAKAKGVPIITVQDRAFVSPETLTENEIKNRTLHRVPRTGSKRFGEHVTEDWRHEHRYRHTNRLKSIPEDYTDPTYMIGSTLSGGNCSFNRATAFEVGLFDEKFGRSEDVEFGVRMYEHFNVKLKKKLYFVPVPVMAYHLEHGAEPDPATREKERKAVHDKIALARKSKVLPLPEVSIYAPCYNQEKFIERAIASIARQKFDLSRLEVVVGEDGSTDASLKILQRLQRQYSQKFSLRIISDGKNHGMAENTNRTLHACRGKYILQLDPDDELLENAVSTLYDTLEKNPWANLAFGDCLDRNCRTGKTAPHWSCAEFTSTWYTQQGPVSKEMRVSILGEAMRIHHPRMFRREAFFQTEGINPNLENAVDYDFYAKMAEIGAPLHVKKTLYLYNTNHGGNTTSQGKLQGANGEVVKRTLAMRNSGQKRKEVYLLDENKKIRHYDLNLPTLRQDTLEGIWREEEAEKKRTKLYSALIKELESMVYFFRWVQPETAENSLEQLLDLEPENNLGRYYLATYHYHRKEYSEALKVLSEVSGSSARTLERMVHELMEAEMSA